MLDRKWFYAIDHQRQGPVPFETLCDLAGSGELALNDLVWTKGMPEWQLASSVAGLFLAETRPPSNEATPAVHATMRAPQAGTRSKLPVIAGVLAVSALMGALLYGYSLRGTVTTQAAVSSPNARPESQAEDQPPVPTASNTAVAKNVVADGVRVVSVDLGTSIDANQHVDAATTTFAPTDKIYAAITTAGAAPSVELEAKWTYEDGQTIADSRQVIAPNGPAATSFYISKPDPWPPGRYAVDILMDGKPVASRSYAIVAPTATEASLSIQTVTATDAPATNVCESDAPEPQSAEERDLVSDGRKHLTGRSLRGGTRGEYFFVEAALGYDTQCRPDPYQVYAFKDGKRIGTLSAHAMRARSDGAITRFDIASPGSLRIVEARYKPNDPACCPSSTQTRDIAFDQLSRDEAPAKSPPQQPPSFDCGKASTATEKAICADPELSSLDGEMGRVFGDAVAASPPDQLKTLRAEQNAWIKSRDATCVADVPCLANSLRQRMSMLRDQQH